jgi:sugar lactone lactonase YvrE
MKRPFLLSTFILLFAFSKSQTIPAYLPTNGLVAWYPFNGNANDESGNGNHGNNNGAILVYDRYGVNNSAYSFDGSTHILTNNAGPVGTGITLSFWYKSTQNYMMQTISYGSTAWGGYFGAYLNHYSAQTTGPCYGPSLTNAGTLINRNAEGTIDSNWHHAVIIIPTNAQDLTDVITYKDGIQLTEICSYANYGAPSPNINSGNPIKIGGGWYSGYPYNDFNGQLDDIGFWNRVLTPSEITQLFNGNPCPTELDLFTQDSVRICGATYLLDAGGGNDSYSWNTGDTTSSINVTSTGWYKCIVSQGTCIDKDSVFVSLINASIENSDTSLCSENNIVLDVKSVARTPTVGVMYLNPSIARINDTTRWHYLALTKSGLQGKFYFDGNLIATSSFENNPYIWNSILLGATQACVSCSPVPNFNGSIDELRISNTIRTSSEITGHYLSGSPLSKDENTIALFNFDTPTPGQIINQVNGGTGNLFGGAFYAVGKFGSGVYFNGIDAYSRYSMSLPVNNMTIEFWYKSSDTLATLAMMEYAYNTGISLNINENSLSYLWSTGETTPSISVIPPVTTTYQVLLSDGINSCSDSITIYVNQPAIINEQITACDNFYWNGQSYTQSGVYTWTGLTANGCDSLTILNLIIHQSADTTRFNKVLCEGEQLTVNGQTIDSAGVYLFNYQTINGCDSIVEYIVEMMQNELSGENSCEGSTLNIESNATDIVRFDWFNGSTLIKSKPLSYASAATWSQASYHPAGMHYQESTGSLFVAEAGNHRVVRWDPGAMEPVVVAGGNGAGSSANQLNSPLDVFVTASGSVYVSDYGNHRVVRWDSSANQGIVVAGGNGQGGLISQLSNPVGLWVDAQSRVYVADFNNNRVMLWNPGASTGSIYRTGTAPSDVFFDIKGNFYMSQYYAANVLRWSAGSNQAVIVANAPYPYQITVDRMGTVFVAQHHAHIISRHFSGMPQGDNLGLQFWCHPFGLAISSSGSLFMGEHHCNHRIRRFEPGILQQDSLVAILSGNYSVIATRSNSCATTSNQLTIFNPSTSVSSSHHLEVCPGDTSTLSVVQQTGLIYQWQKNGEDIPGFSGPQFTVTEPGAYRIKVSDSNGCVFFSSELLMRGLPNVSLSSTGGCLSDSLYVETADSNVAVVEWYRDGLKVQSQEATYDYGIPVAINMNGPAGIHVDASGNTYIADSENDRVVKWPRGATQGIVVAGGNGRGNGLHQLNRPTFVVVDEAGGIYITDRENHRVVKWLEGSPIGMLVAGGNGQGGGLGQLNTPHGIWVNGLKQVFVSDHGNHRVMRWDPGAIRGVMVAGNNIAGSASNQLNGPAGIFMTNNGTMYIADHYNHRIQRWSPGASSGVTVAGGNGAGVSMNQLNRPWDISVDRSGSLYISDNGNHRIMRWGAGASRGDQIAGVFGYGNAPGQLNHPLGVRVDHIGRLYVSEGGRGRIVLFTPENLSGKSFSPNSAGTYTAQVITYGGCRATVQGSAVVTNPVVDLQSSKGNLLCFGDSSLLSSVYDASYQYRWYKDSQLIAGSSNNTLMVTEPGRYQLEVENVQGCKAFSRVYELYDVPPVSISSTGNCADGVTSLQLNGNLDSNAVAVHWMLDEENVFQNQYVYEPIGDVEQYAYTHPNDLFLSRSGKDLYVAQSNQHRVWKKDLETGITTTVAGMGGAGYLANQLNTPLGIYVSSEGSVYVADHNNHRVMRYDAGADYGVLVAGSFMAGNDSVSLNGPTDVWVDAMKNIYVVDHYNHRIQRWSAGASYGVTVAGGNGAGGGLNQLNRPSQMVMDAEGWMYITDQYNHRVMRWWPGAPSGEVVAGGNGSGGELYQLYYPVGISIDASGALYISDNHNHRVVRWVKGSERGEVVLGGNGPGGSTSQLYHPEGIDVAPDGKIFVSDNHNHRIMRYFHYGIDTAVYRPARGGDYKARVYFRNGCYSQSNIIHTGNIDTNNLGQFNYFNDFQKNSEGWNTNERFSFGGTRLLGPFSNFNAAFHKENLPPHDSVEIEFDLYIHDYWYPGEQALQISLGNDVLGTYNFGSWYASSYPGFTFEGSYPARCEYWASSRKYHVKYKQPHLASTIDFSINQWGSWSDCSQSWSIDNFKIQTNPVTVICQGDSIEFGNQWVKTTGLYELSLTNSGDCDSLVRMNLKVIIPDTTILNEVICSPSIFVLNGIEYNISGTYSALLKNVLDCDSLVILHLTVNEHSSDTNIFVTKCREAIFSYQGIDYTDPGTYTIKISNIRGCDSTVILHLSNREPIINTVDVSICYPSSYYFEYTGETYNSSGTYTGTFVNDSGCDNIIVLNLTVNQPSAPVDINITKCRESSFYFNENYYYEPGDYTFIFINSLGCDSTVILHLTNKEPIINEIYITKCREVSYEVGWESFFWPGDYYINLLTPEGCDSTVILHLSNQEPIINTVNASICNPETYYDPYTGYNYSESGSYTSDIYLDGSGCDYRVVLNLTVNYPGEVVLNESICAPATYYFNGTNYSTSGTYSANFIASTGCDSLVILNLTVGQPDIIEINATICSSEFYLLNGVSYNESGNYTAIFTNASGCDSMVILHLKKILIGDSTVCAGTTMVLEASALKDTSYYLQNFDDGNVSAWINGKTHYFDGSTIMGPYSNETISFSSVNLSPHDSLTIEFDFYPHDSWDYDEPFEFRIDNNIVATAYFALNTSTSSDSRFMSIGLVPTLCWGGWADFYKFHAKIKLPHTEDNFLFSISQANGQDLCDESWSIDNFSYTLHHTNNYLWSTGDTTSSITVLITENVNYSVIVSNGIQTCADTVFLNVIPTSGSFDTVTACGTYSWNGQTYTQSGTYSWEGSEGTECDISLLFLTIHPTYYFIDTVASCDSFQWNGQTYTQSGSYTWVGSTSIGCDSISILHLTISTLNVSLFQMDSIIHCGKSYLLDAGEGYDGYTWSNGSMGQFTQAYTTGWYYCTVTEGPCSVTDSVFVSIMDATIIKQDSFLCAGNSMQLSLSGSSGSSSNMGKRFWTGYGHHQQIEDGSNTQDMQLYFRTSQLPASVKVYLWNNTLNSRILWRSFNMGPNSLVASGEIPKIAPLDSRLYNLPCGALPPNSTYPCGGEGKFKRGILIESDNPIAAFSHIYIATNSGATMLSPVDSWGEEYITANSKQTYADNCYSWAYVIADKDNTKIRITPSKNTKGVFNSDPGMSAGQPYDIILNAGEVYQILAKNNNQNIKNDLTGTKFESLTNSDGIPNPIAVFAGSSRTSNPQPCGSGGGDSDQQQSLHTGIWGKRYLTVPTSSGNVPSNFMTNSYKVIIKDTNTVLRRNGEIVPSSQLSLDRTHYIFPGDLALGMNQPQLFEADKPIMVAQFMTGGQCLNGSNGGDPEMIYLTPINNAIKRAEFIRLRSSISTISSNVVSIIVHKNGLASLKIDDQSSYSHVRSHLQDSNYVIVVKSWNADFVPATVTCDSSFVGIAYGLGSVESYGFNIGYSITNQRENSYPKTYLWSTGDTTSSIMVSPDRDTVYQVIVSNGISSCTSSVNIDVRQKSLNETDIIVCDEYTWNGITYTQSGTYTNTLTNTEGCDSLDILHLTINQSSVTQLGQPTIFSNDFENNSGGWSHSSRFGFNGSTVLGPFNNQNITYQQTNLPSHDSVEVEFDLFLHDSWDSHEPFQMNIGGQVLGTYYFGYWYSSSYPDLIYLGDYPSYCAGYGTKAYKLRLKVPHSSDDISFGINQWDGEDLCNESWSIDNFIIRTNAAYSICKGDSLRIGNQVFTEKGSFQVMLNSVAGCDSLVKVNLHINLQDTLFDTFIACDSFVWHGMTYMESGNYTWNGTNIYGCTSTAYLNLTVKYSSEPEYEIVFACNQLSWHGNVYTQSGTYSHIATNSIGCDSLIYLILKVRSTFSVTNIQACDSYTWNGKSYTQSGTYSWKGTNSVGCDSVAWLNLQIKASTSSYESVVSCDTYSWNGQIYTQSGTYSWRGANAAGCDSTAYLQLTVKYSSAPYYENVTSCNRLTWHGNTYTQSGTYTFNTVNAVGCDSTLYLVLTIINGTSSTISVHTCSSYYWNGKTYTQSGTYKKTGFVNSAGCDSTAFLNLVVGKNSQSIALLSACDSISWNGKTYRQSGTYTQSGFTNGSGCDSIAILQLSIYIPIPAILVQDTVTTCGETVILQAASGYSGYLWSNGASTSSINVTPEHTSKYHVTVSIGTVSCIDSITVNVIPKPDAGDIVGPDTVCVGNTATYFSSGEMGGFWKTTDTSTLTINGQSGNLSALSSGNGQIVYIVSRDLCENDTASFNVHVKTCLTLVNLRAFIQGYYVNANYMRPALLYSGISGSNPLQTDTITVEIHDGQTGALIGIPVKTILQYDGSATVNIPAISGEHYIVIKHRNALETWSAEPVMMGTQVTYDFTTSASMAYGDNMVNVGAGKFALWSGDVNQDGVIESGDYVNMENDIFSILFGYLNTDLTGDGVVESDDYILMENNILKVIFVERPF